MNRIFQTFRNKKILRLLSWLVPVMLVVFAVGVWVVPDVARAAGDPVTSAVAATVMLPVVGIAYLILTISHWILFLVGSLFNWTVTELVFDFATNLGNAPGMLIAWNILRDFGNIILLFGFIFIGIATILGLEQYGVGKNLPKLIIFSILLNFSLLVSEIVIDASNIFAAQLYNQAASAETCPARFTQAQCAKENGVVKIIIEQSRLSTILQSEDNIAAVVISSVAEVGKYFSDPYSIIAKYLGLAIFVMVTAFVLLAGAVLLISRAIVLAFLMVTSPIGFAGMAVPPLQKVAMKWWNELICQSFFAPAYLLMIFVSMKVTEELANQLPGGDGSLGAAIASGDVSAMGAVLIFAVIIGFMYGSLIVAKQFSCVIGSKAVVGTAEKWIGGTSGAIAFGAPAWAARRTVGRGFQVAARGIRNTGFGRTGAGRFIATQILDRGAKAGYDFRGTGLTGKMLGSPNKTASSGYRGIEEKATKGRVDYAKTLGTSKRAQKQKKEIEEEINRRDREHRTNMSDLAQQHRTARRPLEQEVQNQRRRLEAARASGDVAAIAREETATNNRLRELDNLTTQQKEERDERQKIHDEWKKASNDAITQIKGSAQEEYVNNLKNQRWKILNPISAGGRADTEAADKILRESNKSDAEKLRDALNTFESRGGSSPPPSPPPPSSPRP